MDGSAKSVSRDAYLLGIPYSTPTYITAYVLLALINQLCCKLTLRTINNNKELGRYYLQWEI